MLGKLTITLGLNSYRIIDNSCVFLSAQILLLLLALLFYSLRSRCSTPHGSCCNTCVNRFFYHLVWNGFLRAGIQMSLELSLASALNIYHITSDTVSDILSVVIAILVLGLVILLPFLIIRIISANRSTLSTNQYKRKYGAIYKNSARLKDYSRGIYYPLLLM